MLSIVVTHHKTPTLLKICLKSIKENIGNLKYEIIVVDSASEEIIAIKEMIEDNFPEVKFIYFPKNVGYAKIVNAGIKEAKGEYILILNADIIILKNAPARMIDYMEKNSKVGVVAPQLLTFTNVPQYSCFKFPDIKTIIARRTFAGRLKWGKKQLKEFLVPIENNKTAQRVDWAQGSAMMVKKSAINKVGPWDERFFMYFEDTDWCRRFWQNGYEVVYLPEAQMSHYYYRASKKWGGFLDIIFNKYTQIHLISAIKYFWKWR